MGCFKKKNPAVIHRSESNATLIKSIFTLATQTSADYHP